MTTTQTIDGVPPQLEPVTMDGITTIREYVANSVPEDQIGDDWTKGYEECKRRIHQMFQQPVNAEQPAPVVVVLPERLTEAELEELEVIEAFIHGQGLSNLAGTMAAARQFIDEVTRLNPSL
ncbi:hypothetical protein HBO07_18445 [Pseudomonas proteolytica]|uniref:hypothetical protein n=1 Tax=Pseudomonas proteolytica TaxID=219574 RepID=UPI0014751E90|nr:hypothetical protein [Pseudomonas proteolytica]NMZ13264.1 hypothetical protein [Pseudomonas proteolytica]